MDITPAMVIVPLVILGIVAFIASLFVASGRTQAWKAAAVDLGLTYHGKNNDVETRFGHLKTLQLGYSRRVTQGIFGHYGEMEIAISDYWYTGTRGENDHTAHQTICVLRCDELRLPHCSLRPEGRLADFFRGLLGKQDLDFDEDPTFSSAYVLQGKDEEAIRELFDADTRQWFAARPTKKFHFEADNDTLVFHIGRKVKPQEARRLMEEAIEIKNILASRPQRT